MDSQGPLPGELNFGRGRTWNVFGDSISTPPVTPLPVNLVPINQTLTELPQEADLVAFTPPLLGVHSQVGQLLPVVQPLQSRIPDVGDELSLHCLQSVDRGLVPGGPQLAAVVQSRMDKTLRIYTLALLHLIQDLVPVGQQLGETRPLCPEAMLTIWQQVIGLKVVHKL